MKYLKLLFFVLLLNIANKSYSQEEEVTSPRFHKSSNYEYTVNRIQTLSINNRHGSIYYTAWDKDTISININIWVEAPSEAWANEVSDRINILNHQTTTKQTFRTTFAETFFSNYSFGIDYHIYGPKGMALELQNRFGNIEITHAHGNMNIQLEYGNLAISNQHNPIKEAKITVLNGNFEGGIFALADINHTNGILKIVSADELSIISDFSDINISSANNVTLTAKTGKFKIDTVYDINANFEYVFTQIGNINNSAFIELSQGSLSIDEFSLQTNNITINGENSPISIGINPKASYTLHGQVENGDFNHYNTNDVRIIKEINTTHFSAHIGQNKTTPITLIIFNKNNNINMDVIK